MTMSYFVQDVLLFLGGDEVWDVEHRWRSIFDEMKSELLNVDFLSHL